MNIRTGNIALQDRITYKCIEARCKNDQIKLCLRLVALDENASFGDSLKRACLKNYIILKKCWIIII